jgi:hypothetical protein
MFKRTAPAEGDVTLLFDASHPDRLLEGATEYLWGSVKMENQYREVDPNGYAYPKRSYFSQTRGGKSMRESELVILEASFDQPIDPSVFTLAGVNPPPGTRISRPGWTAGPLTWDGQHIIDQNGERQD